MFTTLISAEELAAELSNFRVLDCRAALGDLDHGKRAFAQGHIAGAQHADLDRDLAGPPGAGGRHPLPRASDLCAAFRRWGINNDDQIVAYDDAGGAVAARGWWLARWLGHEAVAVLDGGLSDWPGPLATDVVPPPAGSFTRRDALTRTVQAGDVLADLENMTLVDARAQARFDGIEEPIDSVAGHIPTALCRPFQGNLDTKGRFLTGAELGKRFAGLQNNPVCYCGSGVTAAHNVLAMRIAGWPEPALYPGSWSEWIVDPDRPLAP